MSVTIRKHCDTCQEETVHVNKNEEGEEVEGICLPCKWRDWRDVYEGYIQNEGFERTKKDWLEARDWEFNRQIAKELNKAELLTWKKIVYWTNKRFGLPQKEGWEDYKIPDELPKEQNKQQSPADYTPYLMGGGIGIIVGIFFGLLVSNIGSRRR